MARRIFLVAVLSAISIALWAPDVSRIFGHPLGTPGFTLGPGVTVIAVDTGSSAYRAGIRAGRRIDLAGTPLHTRLLLLNADFQTLHPVQRFFVRVISPHGPFTAAVVSQPETRRDIATALPRMFFELILLGAGIALLLLRPSKATWGFFLYVAFSPGAPVNVITWLGPQTYQVVMTDIATTLFAIASLGAVIFALYLLVKPPFARWRRVAEAAAYVIVFATIALLTWMNVAFIYYGVWSDALNVLTFVLEMLLTAAPPLLLLLTYASSGAAVRERLRWVILGFAVTALSYGVLLFSAQSISPVAMPYWIWAAICGVNSFVLSTTVLYAVLKHHVLDINVAISRALVYTILSAIVVGAFALVDLFFSRELSGRNAGLVADIALALVLGFSFNSLHARVDRFVDRVVFRARHAAEEHLRTLVRSMPFALSEEQVDGLLVAEPVRSFGLSGAALFGRDGETFTLRRRFGPSPPPFDITSAEDSLPLYLQGERHALRMDTHGFDVAAIAIPVFSHSDLTAIALYGLHENGTDLDAGEIELFEDLAAAAGSAYDRLEAKSLRDEVRGLRDEVREMRLERMGAEPLR